MNPSKKQDDDNTPLFTLLFRIGDGNGDRDVGACYAPTEVAVVWSQAVGALFVVWFV